MKKVLLVFLVAVLIGAGAWYMVGRKPASETNNQPQSQDKPYDPRNPNFVGGQVVSTTSSQILFKVGETTYTAKTDSSTKFVKQVKKAGGMVDLVDGSIADVKVNNRIIVFFETPLENNVYNNVSRVQILD